MVQKNKNYSGFSFIEAILAVFLIATGMIAVMSLMSSSLKDSMDSRDQIIGVLLSQEGIELVRNLRDNNWANDRDTFDPNVAKFPAGNNPNCAIDYNNDSLACPYPKLLNITSDAYDHQGGSPTKFQRKIEIKYDDEAEKNSAEIISVVIWGGNFPTDPITQSNCNSSAKCAYTKTTLTRWGGM